MWGLLMEHFLKVVNAISLQSRTKYSFLYFKGYYCCPGVHPSGLASISTIKGFVDGTDGIQHAYNDESYNVLFNIYNMKSRARYIDDEDCFFTLSKDMTMIKSIPVSEL